MSGSGHPLPGSDEARHGEIPEHLAREKGRGDDSKGVVQPDGPPVNPDGEPYRYDVAARSGGRGADSVSPDDELAEDQAEHQDRGQSVAASESGRD